MTNTKKLKGRIIEEGTTQGKLAEILGISRQALSLKINDKSDFTASEIAKLCEILKIDNKETYFFAQ